MKQEDLAAEAMTVRAMAQLKRAPLTPAFEAVLLASYDGWQAGRRRGGMAAGLAAGLRACAATVWPGAPTWVPAGVFAAALLIGVGLGTAISGPDSRMAYFLEQAPSFSIVSEEDS